MKKALIYTATLFATTLGGCNVLDVDPTDKLSETTTYSSIENLDLYVKSFYGILYTSTTCEIRSANLSDGFSDLVKYSWYNTQLPHSRKLRIHDPVVGPVSPDTADK